MRNRCLSFSFLVLLLILVVGCSRKPDATSCDGQTMEFRYATLLTIEQHEGYTLASIRDPWEADRILHRYVLSDGKATTDDVKNRINRLTDEGYTLLHTPLERVAVFTSSHAQLIVWLGKLENISAVCDLRYMNIPEIRQRVAQGDIADCGDSMMPDVERLTMSRPDAVFLSPFAGSGGYGQLEQTGIPIIGCADYMEPTPLARAEWMRFYALLLGEEAIADSLFQRVESEYHRLTAEAAAMGTGRTLLTERKTGSVWYVPGGESWAGRLIKDAAAGHPFAGDTHSGSLPLSPEQILSQGDRIDAWAVKTNGREPLTCATLLAEYDGYKMLRAMKEGNVYECNTIAQPFFEQTAFRPDWLLRDYIIIAHPTECRDSVLRYYRRLEPAVTAWRPKAEREGNKQTTPSGQE